MRRIFCNRLWLAAALLAVLSLTVGAAVAHEGREVGEYRFVVGWIEEPAYEGMKNGVDVRVTKPAQVQAHAHEGAEKEAHHELVPVEDLQDALQVEVTHVPTGAMRTLQLRAVSGEPGRYAADLIPTAPGVYEFRVLGSVEGNPIDEVFASRGAGGGFDDIQSAAGLQFPVQLTELRELESAVRGALDTAQQAQDAALAAEGGGAGVILGIVGVVLGAAGLAAGAGALLLTAKRRGPPSN